MFLPSQSPHTQLLLDFFKVHFLFLFKILSVSNLSSASVFGVTSAQIVSLPSNKNGCLSSVPASFQNKITDCAKIFILLHTFFSLINHKEPRKEKFLTKKKYFNRHILPMNCLKKHQISWIPFILHKNMCIFKE